MPAPDDLPPLDELLADAHLVALPLVTRFRSIELREAMLLRGPLGWTEFSPFTEYDDAEASAWLRAAIDFGWHEPPAALRDRIPVNATLPGGRGGPGRHDPGPLRRHPDRQGEGGRAGAAAGG